MIERHQWWFPDGETMLPEAMGKMQVQVDGRLTWQYHKYMAAIGTIPTRRVALDIGAHVGLWSYYMARDFEQVVAFEPVMEHQQCWFMNLRGAENTTLLPYGLSSKHARVRFIQPVPGHSGGVRISPILDGDDEVYPLDYFRFQNVDLIKIDCEGYEPSVIAGAADTLRDNDPVVIVEVGEEGNQQLFGYEADAALVALNVLGYEVITRLGSDYILRKVGWLGRR